jgi:hypothetical protein
MVLLFSFSQKNLRCEFFCEKDLEFSALPEALSSQVETFSPDRSGMRSVGPAEATTPKQHFPHRAGLRTRTSASLP